MTPPRDVIIFGPTGAVGSVTAFTAYQEGAKVTLAMRDPTKPIPALNEISAERVQADLTKPGTVLTAVRQSGAKIAFIYVIHSAPDGMRSAVEALKEAGIELVVLLSSFSIEGDIHAVSPTHFIPFSHARVEIVLEEVYGSFNFVTVRPAYFASNSLHQKDGIIKEEVKLPNPDAVFDWISPEDIGRVCGVILAHGSKEHIVGLVGPEKLSLKDAMGVIGRALGKDIKVITISQQEGLEQLTRHGMPPSLAKSLIDIVMRVDSLILNASQYQEATKNIQKYTGNSPMRFHEWLERHKTEFH